MSHVMVENKHSKTREEVISEVLVTKIPEDIVTYLHTSEIIGTDIHSDSITKKIGYSFEQLGFDNEEDGQVKDSSDTFGNSPNENSQDENGLLSSFITVGNYFSKAVEILEQFTKTKHIVDQDHKPIFQIVTEEFGSSTTINKIHGEISAIVDPTMSDAMFITKGYHGTEREINQALYEHGYSPINNAETAVIGALIGTPTVSDDQSLSTKMMETIHRDFANGLSFKEAINDVFKTYSTELEQSDSKYTDMLQTQLEKNINNQEKLSEEITEYKQKITEEKAEPESSLQGINQRRQEYIEKLESIVGQLEGEKVELINKQVDLMNFINPDRTTAYDDTIQHEGVGNVTIIKTDNGFLFEKTLPGGSKLITGENNNYSIVVDYDGSGEVYAGGDIIHFSPDDIVEVVAEGNCISVDPDLTGFNIKSVQTKQDDTCEIEGVVCDNTFSIMLNDQKVIEYSNIGQNGNVSSVITTYSVMQGDSLWSIAEKNNISFDNLLKWNSDITDPNTIKAGQVIRLTPSAEPIETNNFGGDQGDGSYIVRSGDTVSELAKKYGLPEEEFRERNNLEDINTIYVGQELDIRSQQEVNDQIDQNLTDAFVEIDEIAEYSGQA